MLIKCPECGHQVSDQAKTCPSCGIEIYGKITNCPDCGEVIFKEQSECPNCHCSINGASFASHTTRAEKTQTALNQLEATAKASQREPAPRRPRKHRGIITAFIVAFVIALIVVFLGIYFMKSQEQQNELRAFRNAINSSEVLVLQNFLDMYKDAPLAHRDSIMSSLQALKKIDSDWADAVVNNSKVGYERFRKLHPQSVYDVEATIKIDSLDWVKARGENTSDAYSAYLDEHPEGAYYDEARAQFEQLEAQKITAADRQTVAQLFTAYFNALAQRDAAALTATLSPVMTSFLHRANATKDDVLQYMDRIHEADITKMEFTPNNDWEVEKKDMGEGQFSYSVAFSVAQHIERTDEGRETSAVYKVKAQVSPDNRISELNMKRSVQ